ncbi:MAG: TraB/GumN family protein [Herbinix sp.]|nr:TraB/GumN family protein [Herbinix sp.]
MKKRVLSLLLILILCLTTIPVYGVSAAENTITNEIGQSYSDWAFNDLVVGDSYGIYPLTWYKKDMTAPITQGQFRILLAGLRIKILDTNCVTKTTDPIFQLSKNITVKKVLETMYYMLSSYEFTTDIGLSGKSATKFMKENGIYTGAKGELTLTDTCSMEQACVFATRLITSVFDKLDAASKGFFWVAKSGGNTVYMLGSIHLATNQIYPFSKEILNAYQSSNALVEEIDAYDFSGAYKMAQLGVYSDGTTLKDHVSAETYQKVVTLGAKYGLTEAMISMCKPWYLFCQFSALTYTSTGDLEDASAATNLGIDINFLNNANIFGKPVLEIEGYEYQGKVLDSFSDELEEYLLNGTIDEVNDALNGNGSDNSEGLDVYLDLWRNGDVETFKEYNSFDIEYADLFSEEATTEKALIEEFQNKLLTQRDLGMADYIDKLLKAEGSSTYFIVVGSGHYISDYSVLDILNEKGYEITQIK